METNVVKERLGFVHDLESGHWSMTELCERYGVTRPTGYKWLGRSTEGPFCDPSSRQRPLCAMAGGNDFPCENEPGSDLPAIGSHSTDRTIHVEPTAAITWSSRLQYVSTTWADQRGSRRTAEELKLDGTY